ncbi:putative bel-85 aa-i [Trichonephila clavipes]|nr:putative bel-85 aa-i [Trichonephila clavipes]
MIEYESLGHMMPVENNEKSMDPKIYFLPHHAVMKGDSVSTKLRVVFDGTCKPSNGNSLNSILGIGKMLQPDLFTILVKFRLNEIAFSADIQQMYRQILIDQEDQNFQRIVWRESKDSPIREYKLRTVTYGTASAPYLATRCLFQTGLDLERDDPAVSSLIKESFYIDDLMAGAPSSEEAISLIKTLSNILEARGFHLRKWRSNSSEVLSRISSNWVGDSSNLEIHPDECSKALGLTWNSMKDIFIFNLKVNFPDNITKRSFLSQSARLFDPLGFLTPCTVSIKIFYQQLWLLKLDWDSPLPEALATKWKTFQKEFEQVCSIHIPRWIHTTSKQITLHGFCDASELAHASVIYAVQPQADGNTKVTLLVAKSRVAPLKSVSIPRLELNGALLLARLYRATTSKQLMGDLPTHRVTPSRPFSVCGVDYAGPINILRYRGRGAKTTKGYIALFVCFVTKALHLELVSDLTSEAFIASLKRFCARRGAPKHIYCDNGTTFVGARRKLLEIFKFVSKINENEHFCYFLSQVNIEWHFSPPEFSTLLTQVEAILNSRPLVSLDCDNDPDSLNILTPSHFLIGEVITSSPEHTNDDKLSSLPLGYCPKNEVRFWRKWKMDYLSNLQNRTKWKSPNHNFKVGEIVIIKEYNIPPATWPLGKVIETHPGKDGVVRVVTLRTVKGRFKRPIHKLCKLPLHQE